ncbi:MAG: site-specific integrase [Actinobacteria bacterium]|nr:site-specific integrase [Actinomycetota bacterium]
MPSTPPPRRPLSSQPSNRSHRDRRHENPRRSGHPPTLLLTGVRQGELLGLRWTDIDFEQGLVRLRRQLQRPGGGRPPLLAPLKMNSERDVVLVPQLAGLLREHRRSSAHALDDDFVLERGDGKPLHYSQANRLLRKVAAAAGVERVSAHVFRRTFASHLIIEQGLDVVRVQRQLGHSRPSVTYDRYSFLFEQARHADELRESIAASAYGSLLGPARPRALAEANVPPPARPAPDGEADGSLAFRRGVRHRRRLNERLSCNGDRLDSFIRRSEARWTRRSRLRTQGTGDRVRGR